MLELIDIVHSYGREKILDGVNFRVGEKEVVCLLGSSGSGKSTILRIIAGFENPDGGSVLYNGTNIVNEPVHKRNFGLVFQDYALFPHMTVYDNVAFGLKMHGISGSDLNNKVDQALKQVGMQNFRVRRVTELSGGEQQRVALARSLVVRPSLLMLDEPLGALDYSLRQTLIRELKDILGKNGIPAIYVTHDREEAMALADRIAILCNGRIIQDDSPEKLFDHPVNIWCAEFLGYHNFLTGKAAGDGKIRIGNFGKEVLLSDQGDADGDVRILLKPGFVNLEDMAQSRAALVLDAVSIESTYRGDYYDVVLKIDANADITLKSVSKILPGERVKLRFDSDDLIVYQNN